MSEPAITTVNKDTFWELLASAKAACGHDLGAEADYIREHLREMGAGQALRFHCFMHKYSDMANKYGLWSAAAVMAQGCSDDGFIDFRAWLMAQGKEVFLAALKEPDSLASIEPYGYCAFESLCYVGNTVFEEKTGRMAYDEPPPKELQAELKALEKEIVYAPDINYPLEWDEIPERLPRLCEKHLTPEQIKGRMQRGPMWNLSVRAIREAREQARPRQQGKRKKESKCR